MPAWISGPGRSRPQACDIRRYRGRSLLGLGLDWGWVGAATSLPRAAPKKNSGAWPLFLSAGFPPRESLPCEGFDCVVQLLLFVLRERPKEFAVFRVKRLASFVVQVLVFVLDEPPQECVLPALEANGYILVPLLRNGVPLNDLDFAVVHCCVLELIMLRRLLHVADRLRCKPPVPLDWKAEFAADALKLRQCERPPFRLDPDDVAVKNEVVALGRTFGRVPRPAGIGREELNVRDRIDRVALAA
jgi:hypothetical protein